MTRLRTVFRVPLYSQKSASIEAELPGVFINSPARCEIGDRDWQTIVHL